MSLPKGWKKPETQSPVTQMPRLSLISRPMVSLEKLRIRTYEIEILESIEQETGNCNKIANVEYLEIQPIELSHMLVFCDGRRKPRLGINIRDIDDIKVYSVTKGLFNKREDLLIEVIYSDSQNRKRYIVRFDVDDQYADEIVRNTLSLKKLESDATYWTHRSLTFTTDSGQKNTIDIYPLTPFLATGEEILWQTLKADVNDKKKKVIWIDAVTNYRIFQYSYDQHNGSVILFPSVEDIKISNELRATGFGEYNSSSPYLTGIQPSGGTGISGDVVFYSNGSAWVTFNQVNDPETLSTVVRTLNQRGAGTFIGNGDGRKTETSPEAEITSTPSGGTPQGSLLCTKCGSSSNPPNSKFCNQCGMPLSTSCAKCGQPNPPEALFCGQCGSKLNV